MRARDAVTRLGRGWNRALFEPVSTSTLAAVRIALGLVVTGWALSLAPDVLDLFGPEGVLRVERRIAWGWSAIDLHPTPTMVLAVYAALLVGGVCLTVGYHSRFANLLVFVALLSLQRRNPWVLNSGDVLIRNLAFFLLLAPSGAALSVDRWRRHREEFWEHPMRAAWPLRLVQFQVCIVYVVPMLSRLGGWSWLQGSAVGYSLRLTDLLRFEVPGFVLESVILVGLMTYATMAIEGLFPLLVWPRRTRPWMLAAGALLHLGVEVTMALGFFSAIMLAGYVAFVPPGSMDRAVRRLARRPPVQETPVSGGNLHAGAPEVAHDVFHAQETPVSGGFLQERRPSPP